MRRVIWLCLLAAALWSGWWVFAITSLRDGLADWFEEQRRAGWQADYSDIETSGFPFKLDARVVDLALADPQTGVAFRTPELRLSATAWWPGYVTLNLPRDGMDFASPRGSLQIVVEDGAADLRLKPGRGLEVESMSVTASTWSINTAQGQMMAADGLESAIVQNEETPEQYSFAVDVLNLRPGASQRVALGVPDVFPASYDSFLLDMTVRFDRPIDRRAIEKARPQPRRIDLRVAEAAWGALLIRAAAALDVSDRGLASGDVSLQARNWRDMLDLVQNAGKIDRPFRMQIENILSALARGGGNPDTLDLALELEDGTAFLGFIPVTKIPPLLLP